jgi:hypothetical protein
MFFGFIIAPSYDNPTAQQFEAAYKRLLLHSELNSSEHVNCLKQDETSILNITNFIPSLEDFTEDFTEQDFNE